MVESIEALLDPVEWDVVTAQEEDREVRPGKVLRDVRRGER